ncbi:MAG TPA: hypothetical protein VMZ53_24370 [Kofleriaceae bacterium]|nr:hypothetical protein [Kofleriaceae bacterium]
MTMYRDDHEAALARVDVLEADRARLQAENEELRTTLRDATLRSLTGYVRGRDAQVTTAPARANERVNGKELAIIALGGGLGAVLLLAVALLMASP